MHHSAKLPKVPRDMDEEREHVGIGVRKEVNPHRIMEKPVVREEDKRNLVQKTQRNLAAWSVGWTSTSSVRSTHREP